MTLVHKGGRYEVEVDFSGPALGAWSSPLGGTTVVRPTECGRFAVIDASPRRSGVSSLRIIKVFASVLHARRYNARLHGERLGE